MQVDHQESGHHARARGEGNSLGAKCPPPVHALVGSVTTHEPLKAPEHTLTDAHAQTHAILPPLHCGISAAGTAAPRMTQHTLRPCAPFFTQVKAAGWVGFGLSEVGGMKGSDIVYYERSSNRLVDAFATENGKPVTDCGSQDWNLVGSSFVGGVMKVWGADSTPPLDPIEGQASLGIGSIIFKRAPPFNPHSKKFPRSACVCPKMHASIRGIKVVDADEGDPESLSFGRLKCPASSSRRKAWIAGEIPLEQSPLKLCPVGGFLSMNCAVFHL